MSEILPFGPNWQPDLPDYRDYSPYDERIRGMLGRLDRPQLRRGKRPSKIDLREYFPPVWDHSSLKASTASATVALVEYFQRRALGRVVHGSVRFVYKMTRKLLQRSGDTGGDLRTTLKVIVRFGIPPAEYCPFNIERYDDEPEPFLFSFAEACRSLLYIRLDSRNAAGSDSLEVMKSFLCAGFPIVFGFSVPSSMTRDADIPWRPTYDMIVGGQAVVAVGYDDRRLAATRGALLIRNSWGRSWGEQGYGWLPYRYIEQRLAADCWTLLSNDWLASQEFSQPMLVTANGNGTSRAPEVAELQ
jgi:C1A family cysteine protease